MRRLSATSRIAFAPGSLWPAVRTRSAAALASGALQPIESRLEELEEGGIRFQLRAVTNREAMARAKAARPPDFDPFLPWDPELFVADVSPDYVCLLNKFPALPHHVLLTTRAFEEQETPLALADFEALWACLAERDALGFYNAGKLAGASERHRHLQLAPPLVAGIASAKSAQRAEGERTPLPSEASAAEAVTPIDAVIDLARFDGPLGSVPALPFLHALARLRDLRDMPLREASTALLGLYREAARAFGCERAGRPYNLLVTRDWMLFVPRAREKWEGISVNSLGFAGALLVRSDDALERVRAAGPLALLRRVGVSR